MPSPAQLEQIRRDLNALARAAQGDLRSIWDSFGAGQRVTVGRVIDAGWLALIEQYGDIAAEIGATQFEEWAAELDIRPRTLLVAGVDEARATARLGWALSTPDQIANALGLLDELVKQPFRSTVQNSAWKSGAAWARVPTGLETCAWCRMLASRGGVYRTEQIARYGTNGKKYHGHCVVEGTLVHGPAAKVALRRQYDGEVIVIRTAAGHDLTVTPNHPVLTRRGWVAAGLLREGDDLLGATAGQGHVVGRPDEDDAPARVEDRFRALGMVGAAISGSVPGAPEQFHGDGRDSEVEVVANDGLLWDEVQASFGEPLAELHLAGGSFNQARNCFSLDRLGAGEVGGRFPVSASHGVMGSAGLGATLFRGHLGGAIESSPGSVADRLGSLGEPPAYDPTGHPEGLCERHLALSGSVAIDDTFGHIERTRSVSSTPITAIARQWYSGHVFNLSTADGWYFAGSIVVHNCDCTPVLIRTAEDYPEGYDPADYYDQYSQARQDAGSGDPKKILAAMRERFDIAH